MSALKGFLFRYEQVLNLRMDQEKSIKDELAVAIRDLTMLNDNLLKVQHEKRGFYKEIESKMSEGVDSATLQSYELNKAYFKRTIRQIAIMIEKKEQDILAIRRRLLEATKEKKKLEKLKEKELEQFKKEEQVADDKLNDQIVTFNSGLRRG